jgi:membrane protease YdiL (CAAX protease family)
LHRAVLSNGRQIEILVIGRGVPYHEQLMTAHYKGYFKETRRPVYSAALILPFLCIYHAGTLILHTTYINGADALIIRILSSFTVHSMFGSALVLAACFAIWQLRTRASWKIKSSMFLICYLESICFALLLLFAFGWLSTHLSMAAVEKKRSIANLVLYCGAGIYEELVFRGFLLGILIVIFHRLFPKGRWRADVSAAILAALLFSIFHYIGPAGDAFTLSGFMQRMAGGLYFSILFLKRGFGITAASHAIYDIFVGLIFH